MKLILDHRERDLYNQCESLINKITNFKDIKIQTENLDLGDIIIRDDNGADLLIYERKSISDLVASIKDGRYSEQSYRLNGLEHHNHNIIYLIEGTVSKTSPEKQMIFSSLLSILYFKGFSVMRSYNIEETAYIVCNAIFKIQKEKDKEPYYKKAEKGKETEANDEKSYSSVIKKKKNANITPDNFGEIVLCQIPSVNTVSAVAILKEFKTLNNLIESIKKDDTCLNGIGYETEKKQKRKISKTVINNIIEYLK
jgi:ERCC4-type nuclease